MENIKNLSKSFVEEIEYLIENQNNGKISINSAEIEVTDALEAIAQLESIISCENSKNLPNLNISNPELNEYFDELDMLIRQERSAALNWAYDSEDDDDFDFSDSELDIAEKTKFAFVLYASENTIEDIDYKLQDNNAETIELDFGEVSSEELKAFRDIVEKIMEAETAEDVPELTDTNSIILDEYKDLAFFVSELKNPTMDLDSFLQAEASLSY